MSATSTIAAAKRCGVPSGRGRFLRIVDVIATTGLSESTVRRLVRREEFPRQQALTTRCVGWWQDDIDAWVRSRRAAAST